MTYRIRTQLCPVCDYILDRATPVTEAGAQGKPPSPEPGDYTVCINCATLLRYGDGLQLGTFKVEDVPHPDNRRMLEVIIDTTRQLVEQRKTKKTWNIATLN